MLLKTAILVLSTFSYSVMAQYGNGIFYLALGYGKGNLKGTEVLNVATPFSNNTGEFVVKANTFAMTSVFCSYGKRKGFNLGYYLGCTLGGTSSRYYYIRSIYLAKDKVWTTDFNFYGDLRLGLQACYKFEKRKALFGIRYFNDWNGDGLRTYYGNSDDAAVIGVFAGFKKIGLDINYATDKTPGVLVKSDTWDFLQCEFRWKFGSWDDQNYAWMIALRYEYSVLRDRDFYNDGRIIGTQDARAHSLLISIGFCPY